MFSYSASLLSSSMKSPVIVDVYEQDGKKVFLWQQNPIIMADDLQSMLTTFNEQFDISFDEKQQPNEEESHKQHQNSVNPENRLESQQREHAQQLNKGGKEDQNDEEVSEQKERGVSISEPEIAKDQRSIVVPFLPILEKDNYQGNEQQQEKGKAGLFQGETAGQFQSEQQEMQYYRSLSEKFQDALNQAQSRKSFSFHQGEFMQRQEHYQKKKQSSLGMLLLEKQKRQTRNIRGKPLINSYSQQMLNHYTPIDKRYPDVLAEKKRKVEEWQNELRKKAEEKEKEEIRYMQRWAEIVRERVGEVRSKQEYFQDQQKWSEKRYKEIEQRAKQQDQSLRAQISFKPKINPKSDNMMKKRTDRIPVYEKEPELKKPMTDEHCTFKPNLSKVLKPRPKK